MGSRAKDARATQSVSPSVEDFRNTFRQETSRHGTTTFYGNEETVGERMASLPHSK